MDSEANTLMTTTSAQETPAQETPARENGLRAREDDTLTGLRPGQNRDRLAGRRGGRILANVARLSLAAGCALALSACVTPQEQRAMDQRQCYEFGFETATDGFAQCMMGLSQQRTQIQANRDLQVRAQLAEQNRQREAQHELYKVLSIQRSGDKSFPVCGASISGGMDRNTMTWYGPNCRSR
ncbi:hypothetical protein [Methylobacterium tarhaniae]|uniref:hypothetical protein n=1 Tax=Methylobacterium tarhaniae TaxID=1187852 RepID=UPI003D04AF51